MLISVDSQSGAPDPDTVEFDEEGYLIDPNLWNKDLALCIAKNAGLPLLTKPHWQVINYLRDYYHRLEVIPPVRHVCRQLGIERVEIKTLFGSCLIAWRISGLPHPGEEAKAYTH